mgnify:CR=1 FL=1
MTRTTRQLEKRCAGCGLVFRWRREFERAWRDMRYCSATCQRIAGHRVGEPPRGERRTH